MSKRIRFVLMFLLLLVFSFSSGLSAAAINLDFGGISEGRDVAGIVTLNLDVRLPAGEEIKNVKIYLQDEIIYEASHAPYTYLWDTTVLNDGIYTLRGVVETYNDIEEVKRSVRVQNDRPPYGKAIYTWDFEEEPKGWGGDPDLSVELVRGAGLQGDYAAKYSGAYKFTTICKSNTRWGTHSGMAFDEISANKKYYVEAWVKIDKIDSDYFDISDLSIKLNAMIRRANGGGLQNTYSTMKYDLTKMGTWQKLWLEFETLPEAALFYLRLETIGPDVANANKTINIELYLDEIKVLEEKTELETWDGVLAFPNPFTENVRFAYNLSEATTVKAAIYDESGRKLFEVIESSPAIGYNEMVWDGCDNTGKPVDSGIYICIVSQKFNDAFVPIVTGKFIKGK